MKIVVKKNGPLTGKVNVGGSKNAALPIMAATLLVKGKCNIKNVPNLTDTQNMKRIMKDLGCKISGDVFDSTNLYSFDAPYEIVKKLRGSFLLAAPLLSRFERVRIPLPGGCPIGTRPIDLHLKGLAQMGADVNLLHGIVDIKCKKLQGTRIYLDFPSVGATENLIMAAVTANGETMIENAAEEPEIYDLCEFLKKAGAVIDVKGGGSILIEGVGELKGAEHTIIPDRIEAGTYLAAFSITKGKGEITNILKEHQKPLTAKLEEMGVKVDFIDDKCFVDATGSIHSSSIKTLPYPGFPTDMQAQFTSLLSTSPGTAMVVETVFENRFLHVGELVRMGAKINIEGRTAVVEGVEKLMGAKVEAYDLRGGAALVLAGLAAQGETEISGAEHILRGYEDFTKKLTLIGANLELIDD